MCDLGVFGDAVIQDISADSIPSFSCQNDMQLAIVRSQEVAQENKLPWH